MTDAPSSRSVSGPSSAVDSSEQHAHDVPVGTRSSSGSYMPLLRTPARFSPRVTTDASPEETGTLRNAMRHARHIFPSFRRSGNDEDNGEVSPSDDSNRLRRALPSRRIRTDDSADDDAHWSWTRERSAHRAPPSSAGSDVSASDVFDASSPSELHRNDSTASRNSRASSGASAGGPSRTNSLQRAMCAYTMSEIPEPPDEPPSAPAAFPPRSSPPPLPPPPPDPAPSDKRALFLRARTKSIDHMHRLLNISKGKPKGKRRKDGTKAISSGDAALPTSTLARSPIGKTPLGDAPSPASPDDSATRASALPSYTPASPSASPSGPSSSSSDAAAASRPLQLPLGPPLPPRRASPTLPGPRSLDESPPMVPPKASSRYAAPALDIPAAMNPAVLDKPVLPVLSLAESTPSPSLQDTQASLSTAPEAPEGDSSVLSPSEIDTTLPSSWSPDSELRPSPLLSGDSVTTSIGALALAPSDASAVLPADQGPSLPDTVAAEIENMLTSGPLSAGEWPTWSQLPPSPVHTPLQEHGHGLLENLGIGPSPDSQNPQSPDAERVKSPSEATADTATVNAVSCESNETTRQTSEDKHDVDDGDDGGDGDDDDDASSYDDDTEDMAAPLADAAEQLEPSAMLQVPGASEPASARTSHSLSTSGSQKSALGTSDSHGSATHPSDSLLASVQASKSADLMATSPASPLSGQSSGTLGDDSKAPSRASLGPRCPESESAAILAQAATARRSLDEDIDDDDVDDERFAAHPPLRGSKSSSILSSIASQQRRAKKALGSADDDSVKSSELPCDGDDEAPPVPPLPASQRGAAAATPSHRREGITSPVSMTDLRGAARSEQPRRSRSHRSETSRHDVSESRLPSRPETPAAPTFRTKRNKSQPTLRIADDREFLEVLEQVRQQHKERFAQRAQARSRKASMPNLRQSPSSRRPPLPLTRLSDDREGPHDEPTRRRPRAASATSSEMPPDVPPDTSATADGSTSFLELESINSDAALSEDTDNVESASEHSEPIQNELGIGHTTGNEPSAPFTNDDDWKKEVKALFLIRELVQTERSYALHLESLLIVVIKWTGTTSTSTRMPTNVLMPSQPSTASVRLPSSSTPPHLVTLRKMLPQLISVSRALVYRIEESPTAVGVADSFLAICDRLEEVHVAWHAVVGATLRAMRSAESSKSRNKGRLGLIPVDPLPSTEPRRKESATHPAPDADRRDRLRPGVEPPSKELSPVDVAIMPTQRIPRYVLLLRVLLSYTSPDTPTYTTLETALQKVQDLGYMCDNASSQTQ